MLKVASVTVVVAALLSAAAGAARGKVVVEGPPRFQVLADRERVIIPLSERGLGAVVKPPRQGTAEVILVGAEASAAVIGRRFRPAGRRPGTPLVRGLRFRRRGNGDLAVEVELADRAARADARLTDAPPALVVDVVAKPVPRLERAGRSDGEGRPRNAPRMRGDAEVVGKTRASDLEPTRHAAPAERRAEDMTPNASAAGDPAGAAEGEATSHVGDGDARTWSFVTINGAAFLWPALDAPYFGGQYVAPWVDALRAWRNGDVNEARSRLAELLAASSERREAPRASSSAAARLLLEADARYLLAAARGSRNLRGAAMAYARAHRADPGFPEAWRATLLRGHAYAAMRLFPEAEAAFREVELSGPPQGAVWARLGRAEVLAERGELDEAQALLEALARQRGRLIACQARLTLARVFGLRHRWKRAVNTLDEALPACPAEVAAAPETRIRQAEIFLGAGEALKAEQTLAALEGDELADLVAARLSLIRGRIAEARGQAGLARRHYREAAALAPDSELGERAMVAAARLSDDPAEARATLARMARLGKTPEVRTAASIALAHTLERGGEYGAAAEVLARAANRGGGRQARERIRQEQCAVFSRQIARATGDGRHAEAVRAYLRARRRGVRLDDRTLLQVARSYLALSLPSEAVVVLGALRNTPAPNIRGEALSLLARIALDRGAPAEALGYAREAEVAGAAAARHLLAEALIGLGHLERASEALGDVASGGEKAEAGAVALARAYLERGEARRAHDVLAPVLADAETRSHGAEILDLEAHAAYAVGDCAQALAAIRRLRTARGRQSVAANLAFMAGQCHESMGELAAARSAYANATARAGDELTRRAAAAAVKFIDLLRATDSAEREQSS